MLRHLGSSAAVSLLLLCVAWADEKPTVGEPDPAATFAELDANHDGQLTSEEIPADKRRLFERLLRTADKNKDSKLTAEEFAAGLQPAERAAPSEAPGRGEAGRPDRKRPAPGELFERFDKNHDGKLSLDEVPEPRQERFKAWLARGDKNGDGALERAEFRQALGEAGFPPRPEGRPDAKQFFARLDRNGDGKLTPDDVGEERRRFIERLVRRGDKNGDGALSLEEFEAARPERPGQDVLPGGNPPNRPARAVPLPGPGLFGALDADQDGRLTSGEISAAPDALRKLDRDGDGVVTLDEILSRAAANK